jgi:hypothetical protein
MHAQGPVLRRLTEQAQGSTQADRPGFPPPPTRRSKLSEHDAAARGIDYVTFRRIAEATVLGPEAVADLRAHLVATRPANSHGPVVTAITAA